MGFSLEDYFQRIGYEGPTEPTLALLRQLVHLHTQNIPFENIDVLLGKPVQLEPEAVFHKLVHQRRGGYCFEQNGLMQLVLRALGYSVFALGARVRLRQRDREQFPARTHLFLAVSIDNKYWLVDVGFGALTLTAPLLWQEFTLQHQSREPRRLVREGKRWFHQAWQQDEWRDVYEFTKEPMHIADQRVANWYTSTHPDSNFTQRLSMALALSDGGRVTLNGTSLRVLRSGQAEQRFRVGEDALSLIIEQHFGIRLNEKECAKIWRTQEH